MVMQRTEIPLSSLTPPQLARATSSHYGAVLPDLAWATAQAASAEGASVIVAVKQKRAMVDRALADLPSGAEGYVPRHHTGIRGGGISFSDWANFIIWRVHGGRIIGSGVLSRDVDLGKRLADFFEVRLWGRYHGPRSMRPKRIKSTGSIILTQRHYRFAPAKKDGFIAAGIWRCYRGGPPRAPGDRTGSG